MRWLRKTTDERAAQLLTREVGLHPVAARILASRGVTTPTDAERFLATPLTDLPDPFQMKGMPAAVARIVAGIEKKERITIYGDYDVDGVTSTSLLTIFLRSLGASVDYYVPHRLVEGYGLNPDAVDKLAARGTRLIITVDCGVTAVSEVDRAAQAGVDVVVVDHHQAPAELPRAVAMLNPHQPGCPFPAKELSAVGVTFFLLMALRKRLREAGAFQNRPEPNLKAFLDLVALGTIADIVPLVRTNRILVTHGLRELARDNRPGVTALKQVAGLEPGLVTASQVGFKLGPRINAAGRLDNAATAIDLLLTDDPAEADRLARALDRANDERQKIQQTIAAEAIEQGARRADRVRGLVLASEGWHPGVVGIVATRVVEAFHRPAVIIGIDGDGGKGSCRSIEKFNMYEGLGRCASFLTRYGGHHHAAGLHLERDRLAEFTRAFEAEAARQLSPEDLEPVMKVDETLGPGDATLDLARAIARLAPFGAGNPEPVFMQEVAGIEPRVLVAKNGAADHLKFRSGATDFIAFGQAEKGGLLRGRAQVAFNLSVERYNGWERIQGRVKAIDAATRA
jgi:single-stranded-DNA-specific exonuclease